MVASPSLNRNVSATTAATQFYKQLVPFGQENNFAVYNLGQGVETEKAKFVEDIMAVPTSITFSPIYPPSGGSPEVRQSAKGWMKRMLGVNGDALVFSTHGRSSLKAFAETVATETRKYNARKPKNILGRMVKKLFDFVAPPAKEAEILLGDTHWTMIDEHFEDVGVKAKEHPVKAGTLLESVRSALTKDGKKAIRGFYLDNPTNPTGVQYSSEELREVIALIEEENQKRSKKRKPLIHVYADLPYYMAFKQRDKEAPSRLDAGFDDVFADNMVTPWVVSVSFSKAYAAARPGVHTVSVNPLYSAKYADLAHRSWGDSMSTEFEQKLTTLLSEENDEKALEHFGGLREKYTENRELVSKLFGDMLIEGEPSLPCLVKLPKDMFGKQLIGERTGTVYQINDLNDLIEYTGLEHGTVFVNNGVDKEGNPLARFAMAAKHEIFQKGIYQCHAAIEKLHKAEKYNMAA